MRKYLLLIALFGIVHSAAAIAQQVEAKIETQTITIGDQFNFFLTAKFDSTQGKLLWCNLPDAFNQIEIIEKGKLDTTRENQQVVLKQKMILSGFDSGAFTVPALPFVWKSQSGSVDTLYTDSFLVQVQTVAVDTTKAFKDIKTVIEVQTSWTDYIFHIIGALLAVILIGVLVWFIMRKKQSIKTATPERIETLQERYLRLLEELEQKALWESDKVKDYYTELSGLVRQYIEERFNTPAMELTTDELLKKARKHKEMAQFGKSLRPLLEAADLAKFAKAVPMPEEHIEAMRLAKDFVTVSRLKPVESIPLTKKN